MRTTDTAPLRDFSDSRVNTSGDPEPGQDRLVASCSSESYRNKPAYTASFKLTLIISKLESELAKADKSRPAWKAL